VPVELGVHRDCRLPEGAEVAAYYVVSEALTNAAKHAEVSLVGVDVDTVGSVLQLAVRDDGVGGADPARGTGLVGLRDRVEAAGGHIEVDSPPGGGTSFLVTIPIDAG
jgi:signal transduction histidine kinase